jgi:hypothetical protein
MCVTFRLACLACLVVLGPLGAASAPPRTTVLEEFVICREGGPLIVPVTIRGKSYPFVVDTGMTFTAFDLSLRPLMGEAAGEKTLSSPSGPVTLPFARSPAAYVGRLPMPREQPMVVMDLTPFRKVLGLEVFGLLGMDFLSKYALRLDFDRGRLAFQRSAGPDPGHPLLLATQWGVPHVEARVMPVGPGLHLIVDTGCGGPCSGGLSDEIFQLLRNFQSVHDAGTKVGTTAAGTREEKVARLDALTLGPFKHRELCFFEDAGGSRLGLNFWSRYNTTFDFPAGVAYIRPCERPASADLLDGSGLRMLSDSGRTVVERVWEGSPACRAGVRKGDEVLSIDGIKPGETSLPVLGRRLCGQGRTVRLAIRRGEEVREVSLLLETAWRTAKKDR